MSWGDNNVEIVIKMIMDDYRVSFREVADDVGISIYRMKRVAPKLIQEVSNFEQKTGSVEVA